MKKQFFYTLLFCMMAMVVSFASCSDDDDNDSSLASDDASAFVGGWLGHYDGDKDYLFVFNSNGTFAYYEEEYDGDVYIEKGTYQYNASREQLRLTTTYTNDPDEEDQDRLPWTDVYEVISISQSSLVIADSESPTEVERLTRTSKTSL